MEPVRVLASVEAIQAGATVPVSVELVQVLDVLPLFRPIEPTTAQTLGRLLRVLADRTAGPKSVHLTHNDKSQKELAKSAKRALRSNGRRVGPFRSYKISRVVNS